MSYPEKLRLLFENIEACHPGIADFYPEQEQALKRALSSGQAFSTGLWYSTEDGVSASIDVVEGAATVLVCLEQERNADALNNAIWEAFGGEQYAKDGLSSLQTFFQGVSIDEAQRFIDLIFERHLGYLTFDEPCTIVGSCVCESHFDAIRETLGNLYDENHRDKQERLKTLRRSCRFLICLAKVHWQHYGNLEISDFSALYDLPVLNLDPCEFEPLDCEAFFSQSIPELGETDYESTEPAGVPRSNL